MVHNDSVLQSCLIKSSLTHLIFIPSLFIYFYIAESIQRDEKKKPKNMPEKHEFPYLWESFHSNTNNTFVTSIWGYFCASM